MKSLLLSLLAITIIASVAYFAKTESESSHNPPDSENQSNHKHTADSIFICPAPSTYKDGKTPAFQQKQIDILKSERIILRAISRFHLDDLLNLTHEQTHRYIERNLTAKLDPAENTISVNFSSTSLANAQTINFAIVHTYASMADLQLETEVKKQPEPTDTDKLVTELVAKKDLYTSKLKALEIEITQASAEKKADPNFSNTKQNEFKSYMEEYQATLAKLETLTGKKYDNESNSEEKMSEAKESSEESTALLLNKKKPLIFTQKGWHPAVESLLLKRYNRQFATEE